MEGFSSTSCSPRLVIPAHAGIQVCSAELAWIPAFAGMTGPRRSLRSQIISAQVFSKERTKDMKGSDDNFLTFVRFVFFVVNFPFAPLAFPIVLRPVEGCG